uniref:Lysosomal alpha-mannosidase n=1 Tax=Salmo trutta TaxID=8032 RepID=A0A674B778_SALTR
MSHDSWLFSKMATPVSAPFVFLLLLFQSGVWGFPVRQTPQESPTCGYKSCHATKPGMLNVHLVPHTHDDVGWLKTVDQYFYGDRNDIQHAGVQYILDSVVDQLLKNPDRRFIYVETAFFYRWWKQQTDDMQNTVKQLVNEGRLEFVNGGWCMSDEATTHYSAVIDQMTMGLRFLNDTFGHCGRPRVAWHIDPFGHAREHASMFAQMGYDGFFFGRLDYQDRNRRMVAKEQEMLWRASESLTPPMADLFTGILPNGYNPPEGFCWDQSCDDPPIRDDPDLEDYNVDDVVTRFLHIAHGQALVYKTNHIIMTMGSDFQYENANLWYKNLDKLIRYVNQKQSNSSEVNVLYSTPSCYLQELHRANLTWPLKGDDFFPYADSAHDFWTGYFTSRPALKRYERISNSYLQTCNQLEVLGGPISRKGPFGAGDSETLSKCLVLVAVRLCFNVHTSVLVSNTLSSLSGSPAPRVYCEHLNISVCHLTETSKKFSVNVYNPLARPVSWPVRLPVNGTAYSISDAKGKAVDSQVVPVSQATAAVRRGRGYAVNELLFQVQAPPLGYSTYSVSLLQNGPPSPQSSPLPRAPKTIQNKFLRVTFDPETGLLSSLSNLETQQTVKLSQNFYCLRDIMTYTVCVCVQDDQDQLTVVTDRSQGGGSIQDGSLEIMLHRRLLYDDVRGVGEPLNETSDIYPEGLVVRGRLLLSLSPPATAADTHRPLAQEVVLQPLITFTDGELSRSTRLEFSGLQAGLPPAVHLLTVSQWDQDSVLLRLEHQYQASESKEHSQPVTVNLQKLFSTLDVLGVSEMNLSANQWKDEMTRLDWKAESGEKPLPKRGGDPSVWEVNLKPMEIRTFLLRVRQR